jgi:hypothetical protein
LDLLTHPLAARLQACDTPAAILTILREQIYGLDQSWRGDERWSKWLDPTVKVLSAYSATIRTGVGLVQYVSGLILILDLRSHIFFARYFLPLV